MRVRVAGGVLLFRVSMARLYGLQCFVSVAHRDVFCGQPVGLPCAGACCSQEVLHDTSLVLRDAWRRLVSTYGR